MLKMQGEAIFFQEKCRARDGNFGVESRENRREVYICLQIERLGRMQREMPLFWDVLGGVGVRPKPTVAACQVSVLPSGDYRLSIS